MLSWIRFFNIWCLSSVIVIKGNVQLQAPIASLASNYILRNISTSEISKCLENCLQDCSCLSFQICNSTCQLLSTTITDELSNKDEKRQCQYFTMSVTNQHECRSNYYQQSCFVVIDCCLTSTYCYNDGKCRKSKSPLIKTRISCECKEGFVGERCEKKAKSCESYRDLPDGWYKIFTNDSNQVKVYCQFGPVNIWTLVMSYSLKFNDHYKNNAYYENSPRNEMNETWEDHRLSFNAMKSIKEDGNTLWRITCSYGDKGWNENDIVIATHEKASVLKKFDNLPACLNVSSIDIRGSKCNDCIIPFWQDDNQIFHADNTQGASNCNQDVIISSSCIGNGGEDNFGFYDCYNTEHRCSSSDNATTQLWFGQRMKIN